MARSKIDTKGKKSGLKSPDEMKKGKFFTPFISQCARELYTIYVIQKKTIAVKILNSLALKSIWIITLISFFKRYETSPKFHEL